MKRLFCLTLAAATILSSTAYAEDIEESQNSASEPAMVDSEAVDSDVVESAPAVDEAPNSEKFVSTRDGWGPGIAVNVGVGPAVDLRDPCYGYSARVGAEYHDRYWGLGLEVTWNTLWSTAPASRPYHRHGFADKTSNSGLMLLVHGYLPTSKRFIISLGAGIGLGARYENFSDAPEIDRTTLSMDPSWLARFETGATWIVSHFFAASDYLAIGFNLELNLGNYWSELPRWETDDEMDISLGAILTFSYQSFL